MKTTQTETILIAGGTGLVGKKLVSYLQQEGYSIIILSRKERLSQGNVQYKLWDPFRGFIDPDCPTPDVIINLAGEGIADRLWTKKRKKALLDSRVQSAITLKNWMDQKNIKPRLYLGASAVGYYGHRGEEVLTESSPVGSEFMSDICAQWEQAHLTLAPLVGRLTILRIGIVLSARGGALPKTLLTKFLGILPVFGNGQQFYPWIHEDDLCRIMVHAIRDDAYSGIINAVAPEEIRVKDSMKKIQKILKGIWWLATVPAWALRLGMGEMSHVILNSNRVRPEVLNTLGFNYNFSEFSEAVRQIVKGNP